MEGEIYLSKIKTILSCIILALLLLILCNCSQPKKENVNGFNNIDVIEIINKEGQYKDSSEYIFDSYKKNDHFELYYNSSIKKNEQYAEERLKELEDSYHKILEFFDMKEEDMPIVKINMYAGNKSNLHNAFETELGNKFEVLEGRYVYSNSIYAINNISYVYDFTSCVILTFAGKENMPQWLLEGTTAYLNNIYDISQNYYAEFAVYENIDFESLNNDYIFGYRYGYSFVKCIVEEYGENKLKELISAYGDTEKTLGITNEELFEKWKVYVKKNIPDNVYGSDDTDVIGMIDKDGFYEDEGGYRFDNYLKNEHFEIYYSSKSYNSKQQAEKSIVHLESNYHKMLDLFDITENDMPVVKINMYSEYSGFINQFRTFVGYDVIINTVGIAPQSNRIFFYYDKYTDNQVKIDGNLDGLTAVLHEFIHNVHMNKTGIKYLDRWLVEGLAMYYSQIDDFFGKNNYQKYVSEGLPSNIFVNSQIEEFIIPYMYGYTMVEYILKEYGQEKLMDIINEYGDLEKVLGITYDEFSEGWRLFVENK